MQITLSPSERLVEVSHDKIIWSGRIDDHIPGSRTLIFPYSGATFKFSASYVKLLVRCHVTAGDDREAALGVVLDGVEKTQTKLVLEHTDEVQCLTLAENLDSREHTLFLFKRADDFYEAEILGFIMPENAILLPAPKQPRKCIEFYGDSVTAGELSEAVRYIRQKDPEHHGEYSNSYYSYAAITARLLNARVNLIAQGGISLQDGTGYFFRQPDTIGMRSVYDKLRLNPELGEQTPWDFARFTPSVVVVAIGQNDAWPEDFMRDDPQGEKARRWKEDYRSFILSLREKYPDATIILSTTILNHSPRWDRAIGLVCAELQATDPKLYHFLYNYNGRGTPGHIRIPEAETMALELRAFINGLGTEVWR
jgi:lysophospholipase L1-like esterase